MLDLPTAITPFTLNSARIGLKFMVSDITLSVQWLHVLGQGMMRN